MCQKQSSVSHSWESGIISLNLWDMIIEVLRSTNNTATHGRLTRGDLFGTGDHSINRNKTKTPIDTRKREVEQLSNGLRTYQHTFFSKRVFVVYFWRQWSCHQNDYQRTKSNNETRVKDPQSCSWMVVRQNQLGTQDPNQICGQQKNQLADIKFFTTRMESSSLFFSTWWVSWRFSYS